MARPSKRSKLDPPVAAAADAQDVPMADDIKIAPLASAPAVAAVEPSARAPVPEVSSEAPPAGFPTAQEALENSIVTIPAGEGFIATTLCVVCPGKTLKEGRMLEVHLVGKDHIRRLTRYSKYLGSNPLLSPIDARSVVQSLDPASASSVAPVPVAVQSSKKRARGDDEEEEEEVMDPKKAAATARKAVKASLLIAKTAIRASKKEKIARGKAARAKIAAEKLVIKKAAKAEALKNAPPAEEGASPTTGTAIGVPGSPADKVVKKGKPRKAKVPLAKGEKPPVKEIKPYKKRDRPVKDKEAKKAKKLAKAKPKFSKLGKKQKPSAA